MRGNDRMGRMVKFLGFLTILFFTIFSMFFVFLTRFNDEAKKAAINSKVAGTSIESKGNNTSLTKKSDGRIIDLSSKKNTPSLTLTPEPTEISPSQAPKRILEIMLSEFQIDGKKVNVKAVKEMREDEEEDKKWEDISKNGKIPWRDFSVILDFFEKILPGSVDNKFVFQNKEYEIKVLDKNEKPLNLFMFIINSPQVIINPESGVWNGNAEFEVGVYSDGNKIGQVKFAVE